MAKIEDLMMLARLNIGLYGNSKLDRTASREVCESKHAEIGEARVYKTPIPKEVFAPVKYIEGKARHAHSAMTNPWDDRGFRALPKGMYFDYIAQMEGEWKTKFYETLEERLDGYERLLLNPTPEQEEKLRARLGDLYEHTDFPPVEHVRSKFYFSIEIMPVPSASHFVVDLGNEEQLRIKEDIEARIQKKAEDSFRENFIQLSDIIKKMSADLMGESYYKTMVTTFGKQLDVLEKMASGYSPELAQMVNEARFLTQAPVDTLKEDTGARNAAIKAANNLASKLESFL